MNKELKNIIDDLKQKARDSWKGEVGENRAIELEKFLNETLENYSAFLGFDKLKIMKAIESRRNYSAINYYQRANFPLLSDIKIYENRDEFLKQCPSHAFICPHCNGISSDPNECNSGIKIEGKLCDWKSYGLFGTLGKGINILFKDSFLKDGVVYDIFMPKELSKNI